MLRADIRRTDYLAGSYGLCDYHNKAFQKGPQMLTCLRGPLKVISSDKNINTFNYAYVRVSSHNRLSSLSLRSESGRT